MLKKKEEFTLDEKELVIESFIYTLVKISYKRTK